MDGDADDEILLAHDRDRQQQKRQQTEEAIPGRTQLPNSYAGGRWRPIRVSLGAHVVAETAGTHTDSMMTTINRNYLEKIELGKR
jgi:maltooligosyltrehalose synthase